MSSPTAPDVSADREDEPQLATLGWALRRAALGLLILLLAVAAVAWLFNASIDPEEATAGPASRSEYALPQN